MIYLVLAVCVLGTGVAGRQSFKDVEGLIQVSRALRNVDLSPPTILSHVETLESSDEGSFREEALDYINCTLGLLDFVKGLKNFEMWALKMFDSSTKIPSGILTGNFMDLGQYDECLDVDRTNEAAYVGQHCLIQLSAPKITQLVKLTIAQCLPSSCKPDMIENAFRHLLSPVNTSMTNSKNISIEVTVPPTDCHTKGRDSLHTEEWIVAAVCVIFVLLGIGTSLLDIFFIKERSPTTAEQVLLAFSLPRNFNKLFSTKKNSDQMGVINGIKVISIAWVVFGHRYMFAAEQPIVNLGVVPNLFKDWDKMLLFNAPLSVDTFFLISGLLNAYGFFTIMDKKKTYTIIDLIITYVHRYIRLAPAYWMMMAITGTWLWRVNDGPLWDRIAVSERNQCQSCFWTNILYVNNYVNRAHFCLMQSWYMAADMQMFWLAPFVLYPMWRWPLYGLIELLILCLASLASPFAISYIYDITSPLPITGANAAQQMMLIYTPTHTRTAPYVAGIFAGWLLQKARTKKIKLPLNMITCSIAWLVAAFFLLYSLFGAYDLFQADNNYSKVASSLYLAFFRFLWSVGVAWVVLASVLGWGGVVNSILSWREFGPIGRISYCIYLTHIAVLLNSEASIRTAIYLSDWDQVEKFIGDFFFCIITASILSLFCESPILTLEKMIFGRGKPQVREERRSGHAGYDNPAATIDIDDEVPHPTKRFTETNQAGFRSNLRAEEPPERYADEKNLIPPSFEISVPLKYPDEDSSPVDATVSGRESPISEDLGLYFDAHSGEDNPVYDTSDPPIVVVESLPSSMKAKENESPSVTPIPARRTFEEDNLLPPKANHETTNSVDNYEFVENSPAPFGNEEDTEPPSYDISVPVPYSEDTLNGRETPGSSDVRSFYDSPTDDVPPITTRPPPKIVGSIPAFQVQPENESPIVTPTPARRSFDEENLLPSKTGDDPSAPVDEDIFIPGR